MMNNKTNQIVKFNVGGTHYETQEATIRKIPDSLLHRLVNDSVTPRDESNSIFIDRDGSLFRYILDFYRYGSESIPNAIKHRKRLRAEANFFGLKDMITAIDAIRSDLSSDQTVSCITIGYRGSFGSSRDSGTSIRFRKITRILVAGQTSECRRVFGENLNDTRDPDTGSNYSCRFFLKHTNLEHAFDMLYKCGYNLVTSSASGTNGAPAEIKGGQDAEEARWQHFTEYIFVRKN